MTKPVSQQTVVVVGASSGIGRATALAFAREGARVVVAARSEDDLTSLVAEITQNGGDAFAVPTDVAEMEQLRSLAAAASARYGGIDTWVNGAAVTVYGTVEQITPEEYDRVLRVNALGQVHGTLAALPHLRAGGGGVIIGIGSVESYRTVPLHAPYTMSKFAVRAFYDTLRMELATEAVPIGVTTILPVGIDTPFFEHARAHQPELPKPPPPLYAPEVVAAAIVRASRKPTREVPVGAPAIGFLLGQRLSPALTDALMAAGGLMYRAQKSRRPDDERDNLFEPMTGTGRTRGVRRVPALRHSTFTWLVGQRSRPGDLLLRAVTRLQRQSGGAGQAPGSSSPPSGSS
jgi:NAD(P)-dependent dehydrogenase (short-subunit alcohol dehydrogenase family)